MLERSERSSTRSFEVRSSRNNAWIRLHAADCVAAIPSLLEVGSVDVVVTSPPYNLGIGYSAYRDDISREDYLEWLDRWAGVVREAMAEEGSLFLNVGSKPTDPLVPFQVLEVMNRHFRLQNVIHWIKSIAILKTEVGNYPGIRGDVVVGHYKPINSSRYLNDCHEYIFHLTKAGATPLDRLAVGVPYQDQSNVARWKTGSGGVHCRGNTWFIPYDTIQDRSEQRPHPATFPIELPRRCIRLHGIERARLVMDPFVGIGTSALACAELGCDFVGFEIAEDYFEVACERLGDLTPGPSPAV